MKNLNKITKGLSVKKIKDATRESVVQRLGKLAMRRVGELGENQGSYYDGKSHFFENDQGQQACKSCISETQSCDLIGLYVLAVTYKDTTSLEGLEQYHEYFELSRSLKSLYYQAGNLGEQSLLCDSHTGGLKMKNSLQGHIVNHFPIQVSLLWP